jgi:DNA-binding transcriptional ArsR family regulator
MVVVLSDCLQHMNNCTYVLLTCGSMAHPSEHRPVSVPLADDEAHALADTIAMFATASRLRLLWALIDGERPVEDLAADTGLTPSATSHQLRVLRQARLVAARREGRHAHYRLHDHHLPDLLAAMRHHHEHVNPPAPVAIPTPVRAKASR